MISQKNHLKSILFVGSDRDKALVNGTAKHFHIATNLFCKKHLEDDIMRKFMSIPHLTADMRKKIMTDIFGSEIMQIKGRIDFESEAQFEDHCYSCYRKWDTLERSNGGSIIPQFSSYFKTYIEQDMKQGALLFKRRLAGLGDNFFYNNSTESVNFRFKNKIRQKKSVCETSGRPASKCSLAEAVDIYREMLEEYERNADRAIVGSGPFLLAPKFSLFHVPENTWAQTSSENRKSKIAQFNDAKISLFEHEHVTTNYSSLAPRIPSDESATKEAEVSGLSTNNSNQAQNNRRESGQLGDFSMSGLSQNYRVDWQGANSILSDNAIMKAPWTEGTYMVRSDSNPREPHAVSFVKANATVKCNCPRFRFHAICKHVISVASMEGFLIRFLQKWSPNLSRQLQDTVPPRAGLKKNDRRQRKRNPVEHSNVQNFQGPHSANATNADAPPDEKLKVVFLKATKATTCYGCNGKFRTAEDVRLGIAL